jgi:OCT family organic cation transporter-like MFS transporter 4/5
VFVNCGWVLGYAIVPGLAFLLKNFRYMQLCSVIIMTFMMTWFYFLYESPRWQLINGQIERAEITIRKALKQNGKSDKKLKEQLFELTAHLQRVITFFEFVSIFNTNIRNSIELCTK